jgi:hypothetical protein
MAVCKRCGCAIPLGSKDCDMCATVGSIAPAQQPWTPPKEAAGPLELSSSAANWAAQPGGVRPPLPADIAKARKELTSGFRIFAIIGILNLVAGLVAELADVTALKGLFNWFSVIEGAVFLVIAIFVRKGSMVAPRSEPAFISSIRWRSSLRGTFRSSESSSCSSSDAPSCRPTFCGNSARRCSSDPRPTRREPRSQPQPPPTMSTR